MHRIDYIVAAVAIVVALAASASAQNSPPAVTGVVKQGNTTMLFERSKAGLNMDELKAFSKVTAGDPALAKQIARNPQIVASDSFVGKHPALQQFLAQYPAARDDIQKNPGDFVTPVNGSSFQHALPGMKDSAN
ncbi:MAG TPA: hypothetical protein VMV27_13550 [Candidatus Binataceae bacterium]|nr:hypothetical protein [Candidatus Binataceae bacterium]